MWIRKLKKSKLLISGLILLIISYVAMYLSRNGGILNNFSTYQELQSKTLYPLIIYTSLLMGVILIPYHFSITTFNRVKRYEIVWSFLVFVVTFLTLGFATYMSLFFASFRWCGIG